jgi:hypothetical protein
LYFASLKVKSALTTLLILYCERIGIVKLEHQGKRPTEAPVLSKVELERRGRLNE